MPRAEKVLTLWFVLALVSPSLAQEQPESTNLAEYQPLGDVEVGEYEPLEGDVEGGAIALSISTPSGIVTLT